ncbi:GPW/gp25 family protein [Sphingomonas oligophenolica]|uniref:IraD/Gp25-like domain-containing protein n=1 Tax=Sphingomonas oligophenolica TaxID=301154 RepID=A0A502CNG8_9SPHN|nr:GPW/gp25 family protein [Sphingomonas oligophenolica]TPG14373.1 hypothetical protein EAH84_03430 [Sphingomonas oligophenolica]
MIGMSAVTGKPLSGDAHLAQSLTDLFATRIGSRVCRRDYGSLLPDLIDQAMNAAGRLRLFAATAIAIARWEPRIELTQVGLESGDAVGSYHLTITGRRTDRPASLTGATTALTTLAIPLRFSAP